MIRYQSRLIVWVLYGNFSCFNSVAVRRIVSINPGIEELWHGCRAEHFLDFHPLQEPAIVQVYGKTKTGHRSDDPVFSTAESFHPGCEIESVCSLLICQIPATSTPTSFLRKKPGVQGLL